MKGCIIIIIIIIIDIYPDCYPSGCLLGCVDVIDCLSQQECIEKVIN